MNDDINILIVEDELIAAEFLALFLKKEGYNIIGICEEGGKAIEMAQKLKPDIIFMDIYLKDHVSGCEAALKIVSNIETKIIFLTAYSDDEMLRYAMDIGAVNYLIKPYKEAQILVALRLALGQRKEYPIEAKTQLVRLIEGFIYDRDKGRFFKDNVEVKISGKGLMLITYLCENSEFVISVPELSQYLYGEQQSTSTVRALVSRVKQKLGYDVIENVSGLGYKVILKK